MNRSLILIISISIALPLSINAQTSSSDLISQVCERVPRKGFCESTLRSDPRSEEADAAGLAAVMLGIAASNATDNAAFIDRTLGGGGGGSLDPAVERCLSDCADLYADAVEQMEASVAAASAGDHGGLGPWVRAAIADAESCEEGFRMEAEGDRAVMSRRNKVFILLCGTALRIVELLVLARRR